MNRLTKSALLSVSILVVSGGAIAGNIPAIARDYPQINQTLIELLTTLPSLFIILTVLVSSKIAKLLGSKTIVQLGVIFVLITGIIPVVTTSFTFLFLSRVLFGIGVGLFNPLLYSMAANLYSGRELSAVIGLQSAFEGIGGMLITFLVGQLLIFNWRVSFLAYLLALPVWLLFTFCVPRLKPTKQDNHRNKANHSYKRSKKLNAYLLLLILTVTVYTSVTVKITSLLMIKEIGDATDGSNLIALVGLGAMMAGLFFGKTIVILKTWALSASLALLGFSMFLFAFASTFIFAALAAILCGFAFRTFIPYLFNEINQQAENAERNTSILLIAFNLGAAFAPISIGLFQRMVPMLDETELFLAEGFIMLLVAGGMILLSRRKWSPITINLSSRKKEEK